jgi:transposase
MRHVLGSPARRWLQLHDEIALHSQHLKALTRAAAPQLLKLVGVGFDIAAEMLVTAGDNNDRVRSEAAFAKMCGACPIPAGSGRTNGRHRPYRGGNRQANAALYRAVIVRMRWHQPTIDYVTRRTAERLSKREIIRCLKRYLAREIYRPLPSITSDALLAGFDQLALDDGEEDLHLVQPAGVDRQVGLGVLAVDLSSAGRCTSWCWPGGQ